MNRFRRRARAAREQSQPPVRATDAAVDPKEARQGDDVVPLDDSIEGRLAAMPSVVGLLEEVIRRQGSLESQLFEVRSRLDAMRNDVWASKVVRVGDRLLVGCRHENLVFLLEAADELIVPRFVVDGEYEPSTTAFVRGLIQPDNVCVDVGANFGYYSCLMGHLAWKGRVLSYEADPQMHALLVDNVSINWCEPIVTPINAAVAAESGELTLHRWLNRSGNSGVIKPPTGYLAESEPFTVRAVSLDSLVDQLSQVDVVKIDVEGAETMVVAGMSKFVDHFRPTVILEWSPTQTVDAGSSPRALASALVEWDMEISTLGPGGERTAIAGGTLESLAYQNIVLSPRERL